MSSPGSHLSPAQRRIAELILQAKTQVEISALTHWSIYEVGEELDAIYAKFPETKADDRYNELVKLALLLHERRAELGIRCRMCGEIAMD